MQFAVDENKCRINIENANKDNAYFCPCCGEKLIQRRGMIKIPHFSHKNNSICADNWHYDMSEWHYNWQNRFPPECQEVVRTHEGEIHRADVLIEEKKLVFEFQHSNLSRKEFLDRNRFYQNLGYKIIWIFDVEEQYNNHQINRLTNDKWEWNYPKRTIDANDFYSNGVEIYLQISNNLPIIFRVTSSSYKGLSTFYTDGQLYDYSSFVKILENNGRDFLKVSISTLYDELIRLYKHEHSEYYFGCPISSTHKCTNANIDVSGNEYFKIMPCTECKYKCDSFRGDIQICKKRFKDLNINEDTMVKIISKNANNFINKISYFDDLNIEKTIELTELNFSNMIKSVFDLWKEYDCKTAIFKNIKTNYFVKIIKNPIDQMLKYKGRVYGYFSKDRYFDSNYSKELFGLNKDEWIIDWYE